MPKRGLVCITFSEIVLSILCSNRRSVLSQEYLFAVMKVCLTYLIDQWARTGVREGLEKSRNATSSSFDPVYVFRDKKLPRRMIVPSRSYGAASMFQQLFVSIDSDQGMAWLAIKLSFPLHNVAIKIDTLKDCGIFKDRSVILPRRVRNQVIINLGHQYDKLALDPVRALRRIQSHHQYTSSPFVGTSMLDHYLGQCHRSNHSFRSAMVEDIVTEGVVGVVVVDGHVVCAPEDDEVVGAQVVVKGLVVRSTSCPRVIHSDKGTSSLRF